MEEGSKSKQEEGDIKEKLLHSKMDKDLVSRNEKVQVEVNNLLAFISNISKTSFQLGFSGSAPALQGCQNEEFEKRRQTATAEVFQRLCCPCHPLRLNLDNFCSLFSQCSLLYTLELEFSTQRPSKMLMFHRLR